MNEQLNFNDIILRLLTFWKDHNCLLWQPYNVQVGAGTMNPGTVLRVLGPEPWNIVYVEPSIRPDDGRFGDNPNRMQQHYQLQVILKPDPGNPQELYLKSLEAIGINPREHDIRFVEDNWESPALGAWGLGWEVWLDGQEITQFTYFQQTGGLDLDPVSVELTYGLDRISLALQGADSVWDMDYGVGISYGNVLLQAEIEHCNYYFHGADVEALHEVYDVYEREAERNIAAGLVIPAHDYNLKCSHLFNVLDARGAIGVTERAQYFRRMRQIARQVSELYIAQREQLGFPLLNHPAWVTPRAPLTLPEAPEDVGDVAQPFVLEIGSEELPAGDLASAIRQLRTAVPALLDELRLSYQAIEVQGTPRRLAVLVDGLAPRQTDLVTEVKGPPADRAFDADGRPTRAAEGFARSRGIDVSELRVVSEGDRKYVAATVYEAGRAATVVLAERLPDLVAGIRFDKSMRWNHTNIAYSRPLRWLVALYGRHVVPIAYAGVVSDRTTHGLRPYGSPAIDLVSADRYRSVLVEHRILLDVSERQKSILTQVQSLADAKGGEVRDDGALLDEVANLVEAPVAMLGSFERKYLDLPTAALVAVMKKHQRYFPVYSADGGLMPYFIAVRNGDEEHLDKVVEGNEHVIRARFADADFFYHKDIKKPLEAFLPDLKTLTFQADLGSMWDKVRRLERLVLPIAEMLGLTMAERATAERAATLSKADLATSFVVEMTSLQGVMGAQYALNSGESADVATALAEQYEAVSTTGPSLALALADRLDSLVGLFAVGLAPKGSNDPFALRRAALQIIENLVANQVPFDLRPALAAAAALLPLLAEADVQRAVLEFAAGRLEVVLREKGAGTHVVRAVLAEQAHDPYAASQAVRALEEALVAPDWAQLLDAYARCVRITRGEKTAHALRPEAFGIAAEEELFAAYQAARAQTDGTVPTFVASLRELEPAITRFFDDVLVMDEDLAVRNNRLALLQHIAGLAQGIADLSELEGF